jgi:chromate reductase
MNTVRLLAFSGSSRRDSWNQKLVRLAAKEAEAMGASVTVIELGELHLPIFDEDLEGEQGTPEGAKRLKQMMFDSHGFLIACPEYNSSITPLLKNAIDWASRAAEGERPLQAYQGKVAGLMSASPGGLGGIRGLVHVRSILGNIGVIVVPEQIAISTAHKAFTDDGSDLQDDSQKQSLVKVVQRVVHVAGKLS